MNDIFAATVSLITSLVSSSKQGQLNLRETKNCGTFSRSYPERDLTEQVGRKS